MCTIYLKSSTCVDIPKIKVRPALIYPLFVLNGYIHSQGCFIKPFSTILHYKTKKNHLKLCKPMQLDKITRGNKRVRYLTQNTPLSSCRQIKDETSKRASVTSCISKIFVSIHYIFALHRNLEDLTL